MASSAAYSSSSLWRVCCRLTSCCDWCCWCWTDTCIGEDVIFDRPLVAAAAGASGIPRTIPGASSSSVCFFPRFTAAVDAVLVLVLVFRRWPSCLVAVSTLSDAATAAAVSAGASAAAFAGALWRGAAGVPPRLRFGMVVCVMASAHLLVVSVLILLILWSRMSKAGPDLCAAKKRQNRHDEMAERKGPDRNKERRSTY